MKIVISFPDGHIVDFDYTPISGMSIDKLIEDIADELTERYLRLAEFRKPITSETRRKVKLGYMTWLPAKLYSAISEALTLEPIAQSKKSPQAYVEFDNEKEMEIIAESMGEVKIVKEELEKLIDEYTPDLMELDLIGEDLDKYFFYQVIGRK